MKIHEKMNSLMTKSTLKRFADNNDSHDAKNPQHDDDDEDDGNNIMNNKRHRLNDETVPPPEKITDVIDDCLERIFECLDLVSLLNVANANKRLRPAARLIYKRKYGKNTVAIGGCDNIKKGSNEMN